jgi:hypothetical protein
MVEKADAQLNLKEGDFSGIEQNIQAPLHVDESRSRLCAMQLYTHNTASQNASYHLPATMKNNMAHPVVLTCWISLTIHRI